MPRPGLLGHAVGCDELNMITFYDPRDPWGFLSNFSRHRVRVYGRDWMTSEHAFQAMKFHPHRPDLVDWVHGQPSPRRAAEAGRDNTKPIRADWDSAPQEDMTARVRHVAQPDDGVRRPEPAEPLFRKTKDVVMYEVCLAKFRQNRDLREVLLDSGHVPIVEAAMSDPYWGWGAGKAGQNKLGRVIMAVRDSLRTENLV